MIDLKTLVEQAKGGDLDAFSGIVRRFQDMSVGYAYSLLGDFHLAENASQEAFLGAYLDLAKLQNAAAFPGWFRQIVFARCSRFTRRNHVPTVELNDCRQIPSDTRGPDELLQDSEVRDHVLAARQALPELERSVVMLFYISEFSHKEIADFLEIPETTVNNRLHSSRKRLKKELMSMAKDNLQIQRPSRDKVFADRIQDHLRTMEVLHQEYVSLLRVTLSKVLDGVEIGIKSVEHSMFGDFLKSLSNPCWTYTFLIKPESLPKSSAGAVAIDMPLSLDSAIAGYDSAANPSVNALVDERDKINPTAVTMIRDILRILKTEPGVEFSDAELETNPNYI